MDVDTGTTSLDHVSAQCASCRLHELVPVLLKKDEEGRWRTVDEVGDDPQAVVQIDACPLCNGAWFDSGELDLLAGEKNNLEEHLEPAHQASERRCPRGHGPMREYALPGEIRTPLERCSTCGGLWLDGEERRKLAKATTKEGQKDLTEQWARRGAIWAAQLLTQLPVEVENPKRGTPWLVYTLLALLIGFYALQYLHFISTEDCMVSLRRGAATPCSPRC